MPRRWIMPSGHVMAVAALALAGCSAGGIGGISPGPLAYQHSNAIAPAGYSETQIAPDRYRIAVRGPLNTPRERMEKIATTRAAEIGKTNQLGFFKIDSIAVTQECETFRPGHRAPGSNAAAKTLAHAVMTAEVSYTKTPPDPSYLNARTSFDQLRAELDQDQTAPPPLDPAGQKCG